MWLISSDLHLSDRPKDASRFGIFRWLARQQEKYSPEATFLLGDLTQDKDNHSSALVNRTIDELTLLQPPVYILMGNHDCLPEDTEIMTRRGWLKYTDILLTDETVGFNINTGCGEWQPIKKIFVKDVKEMFSFRNIAVDISCSKNHRILVHGRDGWTYKTPTTLKSTEEILTSVNVDCESADLSDDALRLAAWILTDGTVEKHHGYVTIYQSKCVAEITDLVNRLGLTPKIVERIRENKNFKQNLRAFEFKFNAEESRIITSTLDLKHSKEMPSWATYLDKSQFEIFLNTLILGDGLWYKNRNTKLGVLYKTEQFLSWVQGLCHIHGYRTTLTIDNRNDPRLNICTVVRTGRNCLHKGFAEVKEPQRVWCVSVPLGNFMVRRNGKVHITGNCVDHNNPFFRFLNCIEGIHFIVEPEEITTWAGGGLTRGDPKGVAMIPHCRTQEQFNAACKAMSQRPDALMLHQTIAGAIAETGRPLNGFSTPLIKLLRPLRCYSGDVHKPQQCGLVTYVGAPYRITFGDKFTPRVILAKNSKDIDLHFPTISKHTLSIKTVEDLHQPEINKGDQVKLIVGVSKENLVNWSKIKAEILLECKNLGLEVFGVEVLTEQNPRNIKQSPTQNIIRPKDIFNSFCKREKVAKQIIEAGALLLDVD